MHARENSKMIKAAVTDSGLIFFFCSFSFMKVFLMLVHSWLSVMGSLLL